jgi:hypothetical protein
LNNFNCPGTQLNLGDVTSHHLDLMDDNPVEASPGQQRLSEPDPLKHGTAEVCPPQVGAIEDSLEADAAQIGISQIRAQAGRLHPDSLLDESPPL